MIPPCSHCHNAVAVGLFRGVTAKGQIVRMNLCGACGFTMGDARRLKIKQENVEKTFENGMRYKSSREVVQRVRLFQSFTLETMFDSAIALAKAEAVRREERLPKRAGRSPRPERPSTPVLAPTKGLRERFKHREG